MHLIPIEPLYSGQQYAVSKLIIPVIATIHSPRENSLIAVVALKNRFLHAIFERFALEIPQLTAQSTL